MLTSDTIPTGRLTAWYREDPAHRTISCWEMKSGRWRAKAIHRQGVTGGANVTTQVSGTDDTPSLAVLAVLKNLSTFREAS